MPADSAAETKQPDVDLRDIVSSATLLLVHAAESKQEVDPQIVKAMVETRFAMEAGPLTAEQEVAFWTAYSRLASQASPVTVASLRCTREVGGKKFGGGGIGWLSLVFLVALVILQIYTLVGSNLLLQADTARQGTADLRTEQYRLASVLKPANGTGPVLPCPGSTTEECDPSLAPLQEKLQRASDRLAAVWLLLEKWNSLAIGMFAPPEQQLVRLGVQAGEARHEMSARSTLRSLELYLLPLLYGIVGACAHVLRRLIDQIHDRTFTMAILYRYRVRILLGAVLGPIVSVFVSGSNAAMPGVLTSLSPFFVAFLAGYGVELFFSLFDRVIRSVNVASPDRPNDKDAIAVPQPAPKPATGLPAGGEPRPDMTDAARRRTG
jgi:hypothetical protein